MTSRTPANTSNWLRYWRDLGAALRGKASRPPERRPDDGSVDYGYSTIGGISAAMRPDDLQGILTQAESGYSAEQAALIKDIQEKEPLIGAHLATRKGAVMAAGWEVAGEKHPKEAEELEEMLEAAGLHDGLSHLCDHIPTGYAGIMPLWTEGGGSVTGFMPVAPEAYEFDAGGNFALLDRNNKARALGYGPDDLHPLSVLTVLNRAKPGLPCRNGLGRALVWMYLFKHSGLAGAARYVEKFGSPFMLATIPVAHWGERSTILATLKAMGRDHVGVAKEGTVLQELAGATAGNTDAQMEFLRYCDEIFALAILGQLATSGDAGGLSKGQAQENVRMDLLAADCHALSAAVNAGLIVPLCRMRYGWADAQGIEFRIEYEPEADLDALATRYKTLSETAQRPMDVGFLEEEFGVKFGEALPAPPATPAKGAGQGAGAMPTGGGGPGSSDEGEYDNPTVEPKEATALSDTPAAVGALDLIAAEALHRYTADPEAAAAWLGPVQQAIREAFGDLVPGDVEAFKSRVPLFQASLPAVLGRMDSSAFVAELGDAMLAAVVNGFEEATPDTRRPFPLTDQPRVPAGNAAGGQWTSGGRYSGTKDITDAMAEEIASQIPEFAEAAEDEENETGRRTVVALRALPIGFENVKPGDTLPPSYKWTEGRRTKTKLVGTSAIAAHHDPAMALEILRRNNYHAAALALIMGEDLGSGHDEGEVLIGNARIVKTWKIGS